MKPVSITVNCRTEEEGREIAIREVAAMANTNPEALEAHRIEATPEWANEYTLGGREPVLISWDITFRVGRA